MTLVYIEPTILIDTREPEHGCWADYFTVPHIRGTLQTGDYSLIGCSEWICIERKSLDDLIGCLSYSRERFTEELRRAQRVPDFYVIVEASYSDLLNGGYHSKMTVKSVWESLIALQQRFRVPFLMGEGPMVAARLAESILLRWYREHVKVIDEVRKATIRLRREVNYGIREEVQRTASC